MATTGLVSRVGADLERRWDELALASGASPFMRPGWLRAWLDAFRHAALGAVTVQRGDELTGLLPLLPGRYRTLRSPTNHETASFSPIVRDAESAADELVERLLAIGGSLDLSGLPVDEGTPGQRLVHAVERSGAVVLRNTRNTAPYVDVSGELEIFMRGLSKNRRHGMKRLRNRLRDAGELAFEVRDGRENLAELLTEGFKLEAREWKLRAGSAILSHPATTRFYTSAARWAAEQGILRLIFLRLSGRPIAFGYCVEQGDCLYFLKLGMDDEYQKFGPGVLITLSLIEHAFAQPSLTRLDLLGENEPYKADFASGTTEQIRLRVYPDNGLGRVRRTAVVAGADLRRIVVTRLSDQTRDRLSAVRNRLRG